ncbi:hypothetical protein BTUL_0220g00090 [Botrytis tulipae]|uniref:Uncharacterized protein n=1 Tax=Botrytis tulipae TaxID=87230 RepID=A0A4Z1EAJ0_9HELO|nr:hypothetical protein BTUL_0220g00090 [Botrytis tulipae]
MARPHASNMAVEASESSGPNQQLSSGFLSKLCFDIRRSVYEQLVVDLGLILHIAVTDVRPGRQNPKHFKQVLLPCIAGPEGHVGLEHWGGWESAHTKCIDPFSRGVGGSSDQTGIVRALQFSHIRFLRISHEIEHPVYTCSHFEPKDSPAPKKQQEMDQELARWQAKHLVHICDGLSRVKGSKDLHITFYDVTGRRLETSLLYPLVWIKDLENFKVELPRALGHTVGPYCKSAMLPFIIRRPSLEEEHEPEAIYDMRKFKLLMFNCGCGIMSEVQASLIFLAVDVLAKIMFRNGRLHIWEMGHGAITFQSGNLRRSKAPSAPTPPDESSGLM